MKDIYTHIPINKTAALVVNQSGCTSHNGLTPEQEKANLCAKWHELENKILGMHKKDPSRIAYGKQIAEIHKKIISINQQIKHKKFGDLREYIIPILKSRMTKTAWEQVLEEAEKERTRCGHFGSAENSIQQPQVEMRFS